MKTHTILLISLLSVLGFCACSSHREMQTNMGDCVYRSGFLWTDNVWADTTFAEVHFRQSFENYTDESLGIILLDDNQKCLNLNGYEVYINEEKVTRPQWTIMAANDTLSIKVRCIPSKQMKQGTKKLYIKLNDDAALDKVQIRNEQEDAEIVVSQTADTILPAFVFYYKQKRNIGNLILFWLMIAVIAALVLWFAVLQRMFYPRFRGITKTIVIPNQAPIVIKFKGARLVIIDNVKHQQSWWNKLWTGKIIYKQCAAITSPITLTPTGKGRKVLFMANAANYTCNPNPIDMRPATVTDNVNKQKITIN